MSRSNGVATDWVPTPAHLPRHIAVIMDGNGRWARSKGLPRVEGHRAGANTVRMVVEECRRLGVRYLTLYAFSTENWQRPADEVGTLMKLFHHYLKNELKLMCENGIRLRSIGDRARLPKHLQDTLAEVEESTAAYTDMDLILAVSYGGREELVNAARRLAEQARSGSLDPGSIDESMMRANLYAPDVPDPDLLIRTSDECRISNFLLWQLAYAEIVVTPVLWPDFSREEFVRCLVEYSRRDRRFGLTAEQVLAGVTSG